MWQISFPVGETIAATASIPSEGNIAILHNLHGLFLLASALSRPAPARSAESLDRWLGRCVYGLRVPSDRRSKTAS